MDDFTSKITELLNDPEGMETVRNIAASLMNQAQGAAPEPDAVSSSAPSAAPHSDSGEGGGLFGGAMPFSPDQLGNIMRITSMLKETSGEDDKTRLLISLRPHLSETRQKKVDNAVKILKLIRIMPMLQESGIMNLF